MASGFDLEYEELLRRVNRVERWIERFGDSDRRMLDLYAKTVYAAFGIIPDKAGDRGLGALMYSTDDPASQLYSSGVSQFPAYLPEVPFYHSLLPVRWEIPAKVANIEPRITFTFSDDSTVIRSNTTGSPILETHAFDVLFGKDGLPIKQVQFGVENTGGDDTQDIGAYTIEGWQV